VVAALRTLDGDRLGAGHGTSAGSYADPPESPNRPR
jgi:hypothetical protein